MLEVFTVVRGGYVVVRSEFAVARSAFEVEVVSRGFTVGSKLVGGGSQWSEGSSKEK